MEDERKDTLREQPEQAEQPETEKKEKPRQKWENNLYSMKKY